MLACSLACGHGLTTSEFRLDEAELEGREEVVGRDGDRLFAIVRATVVVDVPCDVVRCR